MKINLTVRTGCLLACLLPVGYVAIVNFLPLAYTPPALTPEKEATFTRVAQYMKDLKARRQLEDVMLFRHGTVDVFRNNKWIDRKTVLNEVEIQHGFQLCDELDDVHISHATSEGSFILFYPQASSLMPHAAGVVYSMDGVHPQVSTRSRLKHAQPFQKLSDRWYSSLAMRPNRISGW